MNSIPFQLNLPQLPAPNTPKILIDAVSFSSKLKHPVHSETIRLTSASALKSYNGIYHNFTLPVAGDYALHFALQFPYLIKGIKDHQLVVDCASNYIESVTLNLNNNSTVIAKIDQIPRVVTRNAQELQQSIFNKVNLDFLDAPLLTKYVTESNYQIAIKFRQAPPSDYELIYEIMFVDNKQYNQDLRREEFIITYLAKHSHHHKKVDMWFQNGQIGAKSMT